MKLEDDIKNCIKSLSSNGSYDLLLGTLGWDFIPADQSVVPGQAITQNGFEIPSPYNCSRAKAFGDSTKTDMTALTDGLTPTVWLIAFIAFVSLSIIVSLHSRLNGVKNCNGIWTILSHVLPNPTFKIFNSISKLIFLVITLYVFLFITLYVNNIIKTDQMTMKEQRVYRSFRDLVEGIESGDTLTIMYTLQSGIISRPLNEQKKEIMERLHYYMNLKYGRIIDSIFELIDTLSKNYDSVFIEIQSVTKVIKYLTCSSATIRKGYDVPDTCIHRTGEREVFNPTIAGIMVSKNFSQTATYKVLETRYVNFFKYFITVSINPNFELLRIE